MSLTAKQRAFIREYVVDYNAAAAARRAGYSEKTADRTGYDLLRKPEIADAVAKRQQEAEEKALVTREEVIEGLRREATYGADDASHSARVAAWAHLGKHIGMFTDKVEQTGAMRIEVVYVDSD